MTFIPAVFFALGWIAARIDIKHLLRESRALPLSYFRGLNFLLNEQPDKAIELFIEVVKVDPQTIDLHFALGSLFRRQGEIDRAIRMHQNLLDRPDLATDKRQAVVYGALAQDFHRAGLLDRAEEASIRGSRGTPFEHPSLAFLLSIYEQEKDWPKAIAVTRRMEAIAKQPYHKEIAHYDCELAQTAMLKSDFATAREYLDKALAEYKACARATMLLGDIETQQGRMDEAIEAWQKIETQGPRVPLARRRTPGGCVPQDGSRRARLARAEIVSRAIPVARPVEHGVRADAGGGGPARSGRTDQGGTRQESHAAGADRLLRRSSCPPRRSPSRFQLVKQLVGQHIKRLGMYKCDHCGFRAKQYYWRCPGCGKWETYSPRRTETPDGYV